ncbi:hypothetical protein QZH41_010170, partial [Actinostola sp. cb2023]
MSKYSCYDKSNRKTDIDFARDFRNKKMSSDSEESLGNASTLEEENSASEGEISSHFVPYEDEPLASDSSEVEDDDEVDIDDLTAAVLAARYEKRVPFREWCRCESCNDETLAGALEYRCCHEVNQAIGMLVFDGSIERVKCVTEHEDYSSMSNRAVLLQVAPLVKDRDGRGYRRRAGVSENEFVRAVAYRWLIRWLCGYMGWENTRPLPACVYHHIRTTYATQQSRGVTYIENKEQSYKNPSLSSYT